MSAGHEKSRGLLQSPALFHALNTKNLPIPFSYSLSIPIAYDEAGRFCVERVLFQSALTISSRILHA